MPSMPVPCSSHDAISGAIYPDDVSGVAVAELQPWTEISLFGGCFLYAKNPYLEK